MVQKALPLLFVLNALLFFNSLSADTLSRISPALTRNLIYHFKEHRSFSFAIPEKRFTSAKSLNTYNLAGYFHEPDEEQTNLRQQIDAAVQKVEKENRFVDYLDITSLIRFPVAMRTNVGVFKYTILFDSVVITPQLSLLYASMVLQTPTGNLHFLGREIGISKTGGLTGNGKLFLVGDYPLEQVGENLKVIIKGDDKKTFVEFDCNGYKQITIDGRVVFSKNILLPENEEGRTDTSRHMAVNFNATVVNWDDLIVNVAVPAFQISGLKDLRFAVGNAFLDLSDVRNPTSMKFPDGFSQHNPAIASNINSWQGVYLRDVTVTLPRHFKARQEGPTSDDLNRTSFRANDIVLDASGFSGKVYANSLLALEKGRLGNWNFSIESLILELFSNEITEGGFKGKIQLPLQGTDSLNAGSGKAENIFYYSAVLSKGDEYHFRVFNPDTMRFEFWKSDVVLHPSSFLNVNLTDGELKPRAWLNGKMTMRVGIGKEKTDSKALQLANITFEGLQLQTDRPYLKVGNFSLGTQGGSRAAGFPLAIENISGNSSVDNVFLNLDVVLNLVNEDDGGFAARGSFKIMSSAVEKTDRLLYRFKGVDISEFRIKIDKGPFKFAGNLRLYDSDAVYGNGFHGVVDATFNPGLQMQATATFGMKDDFRYWYADALLTSRKGITLLAPLSFYSFGGGVYAHMRMSDKPVNSRLGKTPSGIVYVPDETAGFGFKATTSFGIQPGEKCFNGEATYEMMFNEGGGIRYIRLTGNGYFLGKSLVPGADKVKENAGKLVRALQKEELTNPNATSNAFNDAVFGKPESKGAQMYASLVIDYDFDNTCLHADFAVFVNVAHGAITGSSPEKKAGEAVLHFDPKNWYVYLGRPSYGSRIGLDVLGMARFDSYFVMGTLIPESPPPPEKLAAIFSSTDLNYIAELSSLRDGRGIGFGASVSFATGDLSFLMFYARFNAALGFDIMMKDYGNTTCSGSGQIGIDGWYANGQAYAFFEGKIGIRIKVLRRQRKINILELGTAVVAQAKLPNPTWLKGIVGGHFNVMGGLVKGTCRFEIEIGKACEMVYGPQESALESIEVISQITPSSGSAEVDVFTMPQAVFNYEIEKEYEVAGDNGQPVVFKITLDEFSIVYNGSTTRTDLVWNSDKTVAALQPNEILPGETDLTVKVSVSVREKRAGFWIVPSVDGENLVENRTINFRTGKAPDHIPASNVAFSYPSANQLNFYKQEYSTGYITLKQGQHYLLNDDPQWVNVARFKPFSGDVVEVPFQYSQISKEVTFAIPPALINNRIYDLAFVHVPRNVLPRIDTNVDTTTMILADIDGKSTVTARTRSARGSIADYQEKILYQTSFRTSIYNTFPEKVSSVNPSPGWRDPLLPDVHAIGCNIGGPEPFALEEILGMGGNAAMVQMEADLRDQPWFTNEIYPLIYSDYPIHGSLRISPENRDVNILGLIPSKAVFLYQYPYQIILSETGLSTGNINFPATVGRFDYYLAYYMYYDYLDLANQAALYVSKLGHTDRLDRLLKNSFPPIRAGEYWVEIQYMLPGRKEPSSTYRLKIVNPF
jgi:hypothetical protein